jgi:AcrR family transcriptional regulator
MPKRVEHGERRTAHVESSLGLIAKEGLDAVTLRRVAAQSGCTTGAVTHYFASRELLVIASLSAAHYAAGSRMQAVSRRNQAPRKRLMAVLLEALPLDDVRLREWRVWLAFWAAAGSSRALQRENQARYSEWRALVESHCRAHWPIAGQRARKAPALRAVGSTRLHRCS